MIQTLNTHFRKVISGLDEHTHEVLSTSSSSLVVRMVGSIAALGVSVGLGRLLGAAGLGIINLTQQIATLLLIVTMLGMDNVLIKRVAIGCEANDPKEVANSVHTAFVINGLVATIVTVGGILLAPWMSRRIFHAEALEIPLIIALAVMVPQTFARIYAASLNGLGKVWQSNLVNNTLSIWIVGVGLIVLHFARVRITVVLAAILYAVARFAVFCSMGLYHRSLFQYRGERHLIARPMLKMAFPLLLATGAYLVMANADGVMLGWLRSPREVGLYSVAARMALLETYFLMITNAAIGRKLAALYAQGRRQEVEKMARNVTGVLILIAALSLISFILFGHTLLSIWGREFSGAYLVLIILGIGEFFNVSTGCCGMILAMCGYETVVGSVSLAFLCLNLALNFFLIRVWGAVGAASATAITVAGENVFTMVLTKKKVGILTFPFWNS